MRSTVLSLLVVMTGFSGAAAAQNIFNIQLPQAQADGAQPQAPAATQVAIPQSVLSSSPVPASQKMTTQQYERLPNESDDVYMARMNVLSQRSLTELQRATREHNERMKAMVPK